MTEGKLWAITRWLRRDLSGMEGPDRTQGFTEVLAVLYMLPFVLISLVWLLLVTRWDTLTAHAGAFALLTLALTVINQQQFTVEFRLVSGGTFQLISSLADLLIWSALLVFGPTMLWIVVLSSVVTSLLDYVQQRRDRQAGGIWLELSFFLQGLGATTLTALIALTVYEALGGGYPLSSAHLQDWLPALVAMLIDSVLPGLILLPLVYIVSRAGGVTLTWRGAWGFMISVLGVSFVMIPFAILAALLYAHVGPGAFLFFVAAILLVNALAHYLSRATVRAQQRSRELARLEALGEAIIQAPPDLSTLPDLLTAHVGEMFPNDRVEIRLFEDQDETARFAFHVTYPETTGWAAPGVWDQLRAAPDDYLHLPEAVQSRPGAVVGDALAVKITPARSRPDDSTPRDCIGGIYLLRPRLYGQAADSRVAAQSLAAQIGSALYRAQAHREALEHQRTAQELALAWRIQSTFLPGAVPGVPGWDLTASITPARQTSGDFYDFIPLGEDCLGVLIADVADKGTAAALYMALTRTLIRTYAVQYPNDPARALQAANERILLDTESDQFVTAFYAILDSRTGQVTYANAGHNPAFVLRGDEVQALSRTGIPLGLFPDAAWQQQTVTLAPGTTLLLYTDGVTEAQNAQQAEFGEARLLDAARPAPGTTAQQVQESILEHVRAFVGGAPQADDITLVVATRT